jgi:HK97 family phage major capsid protein
VKTLAEITAALAEKKSQGEALMARYASDNGRMPADEIGRLEKLSTEIRDLKALKDQFDQAATIARPAGEYGIGTGGFTPAIAVAPPVLKSNQKLADLLPRPSRPGLLGAYLKGQLTGDWDGPEGAEAKVLSVGTNTAGGFIVPAPLAAEVIDLARSEARVFQAGARTVPMTSSTLRIARMERDPEPEWKVELAAVAEDDLALSSVLLTAHTLAVKVKASLELLQDAQNLGEVVGNSLAAAMALELDRAALFGSGTGPEPLGILNTSGIGLVSMGTNGAALTSYDPLIDAQLRVEAANFTPTARIMSPRSGAAFAKLKDSTGQPLMPPPTLATLKPYVTSQIPNTQTQGSSSVASSVIVGDFTRLYVGVRSQLVIEVHREPGMTDNLSVYFLAYLRADVQPANPKAFAAIVGIIPPA